MKMGPIFLYLLTLFFFIWDIGNMDGLRQSTEGFYLQILKEMHQKDSFFTPYYLGLNHWSKPPAHFWLGLSLYKIFGVANLFLARLAMAITSFLGILFISSWSEKNLKVEGKNIFILLASTVGFLKYSRIYMMEIPLAIFTIISILLFYSYLNNRQKTSLTLSILFLGLSILVKGPISLIMAGTGVTSFLIFKRQLEVKTLIIWSLGGTALASIWFLWSYHNHGYEFFKVFFLGHNLGKFTSKPYPPQVVIQGLILFGLPWTLYVPHFIKKIFSKEVNFQDPLLFLVFNFFTFFLIWFLPNQKSHHYAFPSLPLFLIILYAIVFRQYEKSDKFPFNVQVLFSFLGLFFFLIGILIFVISHSLDQNLYPIYFSLTVLSVASFGLLKGKDLTWKLASSLLALGTLWTLIIPNFYLPYLPQKVIDLIGTQNLGVVVRKPYFVREVVQSKKMDILDPAEIKSFIKNHDQLYLVHEDTYLKEKLSNESEILTTWKIWKRGRHLDQILGAIKEKNLGSLKESVYLLKNP